ncbi:MAG: 30S ribosomal protein S5 [Elusimicrobiota bacterium]
MIVKNQKKLKTEKEIVEITEKDGEFVEVKDESQEEKSIVIAVNRVSKVVKGGKRLSFNAIVAVGNGNGKVGVGVGKAKEVQDAIAKAITLAKKDMITFPLKGGTIPHEVEAKFCSGYIWMKPAIEGTGLIAGGAARSVLEVAGVRNILTKNLGSTNTFNSAYATIEALKKLKTPEEVKDLRK